MTQANDPRRHLEDVKRLNDAAKLSRERETEKMLADRSNLWNPRLSAETAEGEKDPTRQSGGAFWKYWNSAARTSDESRDDD